MKTKKNTRDANTADNAVWAKDKFVNMTQRATHYIGTDLLFTGREDINGEPSVLTGLRVTVFEYTGLDHAGFDTIVRLHCTPEELRDRYNAIRTAHDDGYRAVTSEDMLAWHGVNGDIGDVLESFDVDEPSPLVDWLFVQCNFLDDLTPFLFTRSGKPVLTHKSLADQMDNVSGRTRSVTLDDDTRREIYDLLWHANLSDSERERADRIVEMID